LGLIGNFILGTLIWTFLKPISGSSFSLLIGFYLGLGILDFLIILLNVAQIRILTQVPPLGIGNFFKLSFLY